MKTGLIDLGDIQFDVSAGIALALDRDRSLMLLTNELQWRFLAGPQAGILELCSDESGAIRLLRLNNGVAQWLRIDPASGQAGTSAGSSLSCRPAAQGAAQQLPPAFLASSTDNDRIMIFDEPPRRIELQRGEADVQTWELPLTRIKQVRRVGDWLAIEGGKTSGPAICLLHTGDGTLRTLELGLLPPTTWDILANGALLVGQPRASDSPGSWGVWQFGGMGWNFSEGQPLPRDLAMLAALPGANLNPAAVSGTTGGTYTGEWNATGATAGPHAIEVMAVDNEGLSGADRITVNVQNIVLTLTAKRISEKLWIIRHDYAEINIQIINTNVAEVSRYILERKNGGDWVTVREILPGDLQDNNYSCKDTDIEASKPYTYRVRAVDHSGATIATSQPVTI